MEFVTPAFISNLYTFFNHLHANKKIIKIKQIKKKLNNNNNSNNNNKKYMQIPELDWAFTVLDTSSSYKIFVLVTFH